MKDYMYNGTCNICHFRMSFLFYKKLSSSNQRILSCCAHEVILKPICEGKMKMVLVSACKKKRK